MSLWVQHPIQNLLLFFLVGSVFHSATVAHEFAGGKGTADDPFQIATADQLVLMGLDPALFDKHFLLVADIDLDPNLPGNQVWAKPVVAPDIFRFGGYTGTFDGNGHRIVNLTIQSSGHVLGLFGRVESTANIRNLTLHGAKVRGSTGSTFVGILAGSNAGTIRGCTASGSVTGGTYVGGLVGFSRGSISNSGASGSVDGSSYLGGLVGSSEGPLSRCYATSQITGCQTGTYIGGLVGDNGGSISYCYSRGSVSGNEYIGGLVGTNTAAIDRCYAAESVKGIAGASHTGGLIGYNYVYHESRPPRRVIVSSLTSPVSMGAAYSSPTTSGTVANSYFLAPPDGGANNGWGTPLTAAQMGQPENYIGWDFYGTNLDGVRDDWFMIQDAYPILSSQSETGLKEIPDVKGLSTDLVRVALGDAGFVVGPDQTDYHQTVSYGELIHTEPSRYAPAGGTVHLVVSLGPYVWTETRWETGTEAGPFRIQTVGQLESLCDHPELWDRHFVLTSDIDLNPDLRGPGQWALGIGEFRGTLDGNNHVIMNLTIDGRYSSAHGLFGILYPGAKVSRVRLENASIMGQYEVGMLVGHNEGIVSDCSASGAVNNSSGDIGGLVGVNWGTIVDSKAGGLLTCDDDWSYAGGLVGYNHPGGTISGCQATTSLIGDSDLGGLVGMNEGTVVESWASGSAVSESMQVLGGLVARNGGLVRDCYATGRVQGRGILGGLVGVNYTVTNGVIISSYASGAVIGTGSRGGLLGQNAILTYAGLIVQSYFLEQEPSEDRGGPNNKLGSVLTADQMHLQESFVGWDFYGTAIDGAMDSWFMPQGSFPVLARQADKTGLAKIPVLLAESLEDAQGVLKEAGFVLGDVLYDYSQTIPIGGVIGTYPNRFALVGSMVDLLASIGPYDWQTNPGAGIKNDPYQIQTAGQLDALSDHSDLWDKDFVLVDDIDLSGRNYSTAPIVSGVKSQDPRGNIPGPFFTGTFAGEGHKIRNLVIGEARTDSFLGLFGKIGASGRVTNLGIENAEILGDENLGLLAGYSEGTITNCYATGLVIGKTSVGGLLGQNHQGFVRECYASAEVTGDDRVGGLAGLVEYDVSTTYRVAIHTGMFVNCYASGYVAAKSNSGGLVGIVWIHEDEGGPTQMTKIPVSEQDIIWDCFFLAQADGGGPDNGKGTGLSLAQMRQQTSFVGWDFYGADADGCQDNWFMPQDSYPVLVWQADKTGLMPIPDVRGLPLDQVRSVFENQGLVVGQIEEDYHRTVPVGALIYTYPYNFVLPGSAIDLVVSLGQYDWATNSGDGTQDDPYQIQTDGQLESLADRSDLLDSNFILTRDLSLRGRVYSGPLIGALGGVLDGMGHTILNLSITVEESSGMAGSCGLLSSVEKTGQVQNLNLVNVRIVAGAGNDSSGMLAGTNAGAILHCHSSGLITGGDCAGALVGTNSGIISYCHANGQVVGDSTLGGLVGTNSGDIMWSHADCSVSGSGDDIGGLIGTNFGTVSDSDANGAVLGSDYVGGLTGSNSQGVVLRSYAGGPVTGNQWVGGLTGMNDKGSISECCAWSSGSVIGSTYVGGLAGENNGDVTNSYARGSVIGKDYLGGLVGVISYKSPPDGYSGLVTKCYSCSYIESDSRYSAVGQLVGCILDRNNGKFVSTASSLYIKSSYFAMGDRDTPASRYNNGLGLNYTDSQLKQRKSFTDWDFDDIWFMPANDYPRLAWELSE